MSDPRYGVPPPPVGERWNVNMPAVIGVVFVFLLAVVVWVIAGTNESAAPGPTSAATTSSGAATTSSGAATTGAAVTTTGATASLPSAPPTTLAPTTVAPTTVAPTTVAPTTVAPTTVAPTTAGPTTAAPTTTGAGGGAIEGDLGIPGRPMERPSCDDTYITVLGSAVGDQATANAIEQVLDTYPGSSYLRTDQTCPSLNPDVDGQPIYVVYFGPFAVDSDACSARARGPAGAYARRLSDDFGPNHTVDCP